MAKTGTISFVNSLAGYAQNKSGEVMTFAIIANNETHKNAAVAVIDRIVLRIVGSSPDDKSTPPRAANRNQNQNANTNTENRTNFVTNAAK